MNTWNKICTLSLVHFMAYPEMQSGEGDFVATIHEIGKRNFFGALELGTINQPAERSNIVQALREYDLQVAYGAQPLILSQNLNLNAFELQPRLNALQTIKYAIDQAAEIGVTNFVILSGKDPGETLRQQAYVILEESILNLGAYALQYGIHIILETFDRSIDKKVLVGPSFEAAEIAKKIRRSMPSFGLLYDMGHMPLLDETPLPALQILQGTLAEVHLGNCVKTPGHTGYGDKHPGFGYQGGVNSTAELVEFIQALFATGYLSKSPATDELPWLGFEIRPQDGETTQHVLDNIQETCQQAWAQIEDLIETGE